MLPQLIKKYPKVRQYILRPFVFDINPNLVSALSLLAAVVAGYSFFLNSLFVAAFFWALNGYLDILDGEIARKLGRSSGRGDFIDHTVDRLSDVIVFVGLAYNPFVSKDLAFITLVCIVLVSYLGTQAQAITKMRIYGGLIGNSDRHLILFLGAVATFMFAPALVYSIYLILILSVITFFQRFFMIYKSLGSE